MTFPSSLPKARIQDPLAVPALRWGILGPGWIAERFVPSLKESTRQEILAVGGRSRVKAQPFADRWRIPKVRAGIQELVGDFTVTANDNASRLGYKEEPNRYAQLFHEAVHFARCVGEGPTDSPMRPLADAIVVLEARDEVRRHLGILFDEERRGRSR